MIEYNGKQYDVVTVEKDDVCCEHCDLKEICYENIMTNSTTKESLPLPCQEVEYTGYLKEV